jgi:hypothetical protein
MDATIRRFGAALLSLTLASRVGGQSRYSGILERILGAWETADVVCLGEGHGRYFDNELRMAVVRHPAFPGLVQTVVVEMANGVHQDMLDRFVLDGAAMSREELAPVWRDATNPEVWETPIYEQFLRAVREVNLRLPREKRIRVLAGDGTVDWSKITRPEELIPFMNRGGNIRTIIAEQVLDKRLKALAIYGSGHCAKVGLGFPGDLAGRYARTRFWSIYPLARKEAVAKAQSLFGLGPEPAYIVVAGTPWSTAPIDMLPPPLNTRKIGEVADAIVYHGAVPDSIVATDMATLRAQFGAELARREKILTDAVKLRQKRPQ